LWVLKHLPLLVRAEAHIALLNVLTDGSAPALAVFDTVRGVLVPVGVWVLAIARLLDGAVGAEVELLAVERVAENTEFVRRAFEIFPRDHFCTLALAVFIDQIFIVFSFHRVTDRSDVTFYPLMPVTHHIFKIIVKLLCPMPFIIYRLALN